MHMRVNTAFVCFMVLVAYCMLSVAGSAYAQEERYDLVYIWDKDLESVLDYKDQLSELFDSDVSNRFKIVGRNDEYGVIYDTNGLARNIIQEMARHAAVLRTAGLREAWAIKDEGYYQLFNVSYGLGPNLESLKKTYDQLYRYLGREVGRNLFIEKTNADNYTLIFRCRDDRVATRDVARAHAKMLRGKKIRTSITPENNNEVVYGESSLLDDSDTSPGTKRKAVADVAAEPADDGKATAADTAEETVAQQKREISPLRSKAVNKKVVSSADDGDDMAEALQKGDTVVSTRSGSPSFERNIQQFIKEQRKKGAIRKDERTGWMVYDLENDTYLVDINANEVFQAASMIKPFVALAYFHEVKRGKLSYGNKGRQMVESMIQHSSNSATNWVMRQVGGPAKCEQILHSNYRRIFRNTSIKEYIPAGGRTYRNSALPSDYVRFLRALWNEELPYCKEMRRVMALPGRDRIYSGTKLPQGTLVYNKTGSTAQLIGDMGILVPKNAKGKRHPYVIVGIIERRSRASDYGHWMMAKGNVIRQFSSLVYGEMKKKYSLH